MVEGVVDGSGEEISDEGCGVEDGWDEGGGGGDFADGFGWGGEVFGKHEVAGAAG